MCANSEFKNSKEFKAQNVDLMGEGIKTVISTGVFFLFIRKKGLQGLMSGFPMGLVQNVTFH